jgi:dihydropteroate synthase
MLALAHPGIMGIVNVTPDSFYAGARTETVEAAIERGRRLFAEGADVVDVGGESTRPGATPVDLEVELARVVPVVEALASLGPVSVDTTKAEVARAAAAAGAVLVNDVAGVLGPLCAELGLGWVAMHAQGAPATMQDDPRYDDVVAEVGDWLEARAQEARALGIEELWLDPGIGFGKSAAHNWTLLRHGDELAARAHDLGARYLVGTSRKRFLGLLAGDVPAEERLDASLATAVAAWEAGADTVRVHDVALTRQAARILDEEMVIA